MRGPCVVAVSARAALATVDTACTTSAADVRLSPTPAPATSSTGDPLASAVPAMRRSSIDRPCTCSANRIADARARLIASSGVSSVSGVQRPPTASRISARISRDDHRPCDCRIGSIAAANRGA